MTKGQIAGNPKIVQPAYYQTPKVQFFPASQNGGKISPDGDSGKIPETPQNMGVPTVSDTPLEENSGKKGKAGKVKINKQPKATKTPTVPPTPGPEGYKVDCASMTATQLRAAYLSEYGSWSKRKFECKKKGWPWSPEWEGFKDFLLYMGPKPSPAHTLDREKNHIQAYGPGLCKWKTPEEQNNNKSDNIQLTEPLTEKVWTPQKLAKLHKIKVQTVYKRISQHWSVLELIAGKKSYELRELWVKLDELPKPSPASKKVLNPLKKMPPFHYPYDDWHPIEDDEAYYEETGIMRATHYDRYRADYDAVAAWVATVNAGLPVPALPELKLLKFTPPTPERMAQIYNKPTKPAPAKPQVAPSVIGYAPDDEDDYDPADCMPDPDEDY